ncbi:hypothetical protein [Tessaracoccus sp. ZS01]|uniref:DUF6912 family protein n=1 Tax=Tessaracoccus sp. ZS01 TaxID=1906324 RepID=UPI0009F9701B|nr:hypothetical protein [Tessaracoccus sp. ZS01]MCG6566420.1 hypothetical protein [Tessaracoccus sp. ZS01]
MKRQLVFIPIASDELGMLLGEPAVENRTAYTVTPELLAELEYGDDESEAAEHAAMVLASVAGLAQHGERTIVVAEVDEAAVLPGEDTANGQVMLAQCPARAMIAWFSEEPGVDVADAAAISKGLTIDQAWGQPQVQELLENHELLWNDKVEYQGGS